MASSSRNTQLVRILKVLREIDRQGGADLYELAERHDTAVRTIRRDLQALQEAGLPVVEDGTDGARKRWRIAYREKLGQMSDLLDLSHYLALRLAMDGGAHRKTSLFTALEDLADKIEGALGPKDREQLVEIGRAIHSWEKFTYQKTPPDVLWPLVAAINRKRLCTVRYRAVSHDEGEKEFRLLPLKVLAYDQALYLHGYVEKYDTVIVLNLQRLVGLTVLEETGNSPKGYDAEKLAHSAFGVFVGKETARYKLRFSEAAARRIRERNWHPTQKLRDRKDGGVELDFTCYASPEVDGWVTSFGADVDVIEPVALREKLGALGRALAARYASAPIAS